jgi:hypothetical protein
MEFKLRTMCQEENVFSKRVNTKGPSVFQSLSGKVLKRETEGQQKLD